MVVLVLDLDLVWAGDRDFGLLFGCLLGVLLVATGWRGESSAAAVAAAATGAPFPPRVRVDRRVAAVLLMVAFACLQDIQQNTATSNE